MDDVGGQVLGVRNSVGTYTIFSCWKFAFLCSVSDTKDLQQQQLLLKHKSHELDIFISCLEEHLCSECLLIFVVR